jgi:oxygen-independent coproporphyrinogen-3 oxidase
MKELGIYVHIPFCVKKCKYCDFVSFENKQDLEKEYIEAINKTILSEKNLDDCIISTIYFGGGTPSSISSELLVSVLENIKFKFQVSKDAEITIEVNPRNSNRRKIKSIQRCRF